MPPPPSPVSILSRSPHTRIDTPHAQNKQVAYLNAKLFNTRRIYFVGNFLRHNHLSGQQLSFAIDYWSSGEMEALFLEHEGYCGALGSFLMSGTEEPIGENGDPSPSHTS